MSHFTTATLLAFCLAMAPHTSVAYGFDSQPNTCKPSGVGLACAGDSDCRAMSEIATVCLQGSCQIPCQLSEGEETPVGAAACALGETCVRGERNRKAVYYCKSSAFHLDLNLVDTCISYFLERTQPTFDDSNTCSLQANLDQLLDQNSDSAFDIYDLDLCIRSYLNDDGCDEANKTCTSGQIYCEEDAICGPGSFCDTERHRCERECGLIQGRENKMAAVLERTCSAGLTECDYDRGRCEGIELDGMLCQVNSDCPQGAYCLMGECRPTCYRNIDCPSSEWMCATDNTCRPKPPKGDADFVFDPEGYSVAFGMQKVAIDSIRDHYQIPVVIMDLVTRKQVIKNPQVVFGYRAELIYDKKQASECLAEDLESNPDKAELRADCVISPDEEFVTLLKPYGTLSAAGDPTFDVILNTGNADKLSPGDYRVKLKLTFSNGNQSSVTLLFSKTTESGYYRGRLSVYDKNWTELNDNVLGTTNLAVQLHIDKNNLHPLYWYELESENNLDANADFIDYNSGEPISGYIDGNATTLLDEPRALSAEDNRIPVKGIYMRDQGRIHLVAVIELEKDFCRALGGGCSQLPTALNVTNTFGRKIRRIIHFMGPYDALTRQFSGIYRESIYGLLPDPVVLEGGFIVHQVVPDETPILLDEPLIADDKAAPVVFAPYDGGRTDILNAIDAEIGQQCRNFPEFSAQFSSQQRFACYLDRFENGSTASQNCSALGIAPGSPSPWRVFEQLKSFTGAVKTALNNMSIDANSYITINQYLRGQVFFCDANHPTNCVDDAAVRCGLALYRKAIALSWVGSSVPGTGHELFCQDNQSPDCLELAVDNPSLKTRQEHNRFYQEMLYALKYKAGNDLSDAFFLMYLNAAGDLESGVAASIKEQRLMSAWQQYEMFRREVFGPVATSTLYAWPMLSFNTLGRPLIAQFHAMMNDRLDAVVEIVDLKRRLLLQHDVTDGLFGQQLLHVEYLNHVFLMQLQKKWEGTDFHYAGQTVAMLEKGDLLLAKLDDTRNPLGLRKSEVYFENANLSETNWSNYASLLLGAGRDVGKIQEVENSVAAALENMRNSLASKANFETQVLHAKGQYESTMDVLCGSEAADCQEFLPQAANVPSRGCEGKSCIVEYNCDNASCTSVTQRFNSAVHQFNANNDVSCRLDAEPYLIQVGATERHCFRGQLGTLLQEREQLKLKLSQSEISLASLLREIEIQSDYIAKRNQQNRDLRNFIVQNRLIIEGLDAAKSMIDTSLKHAETAAGALHCIVILGLANGTDCAQVAAEAGLKSAALGIAEVASIALAKLAAAEDLRANLRTNQASYDAEHARDVRDLEQLSNKVTGIIGEYEMTLKQLFAVNLRIDDTYYQAKQASERYSEELGSLVDHLIGPESGSVLLRNKYVTTANRQFEELLVLTYKMTMAYIHAYNLAELESSLTNQVFLLMTPDDVREFVNYLTSQAREMCGRDGYDCDSVNNIETLKLSLRELNFPGLNDIVDGRSGKILRKGEQFHNRITSSDYIKRRQRGGFLVDQIEIPFAVLADPLRNADGSLEWMLSPLECDHVVSGAAGGTIAVNIIGRDLKTVSYELQRGFRDHMRACESKVVFPPGGGQPYSNYPVNYFSVGYAPQSALAKEDQPPTYQTTSSKLTACLNSSDAQRFIRDENCYKYFARDRSLAADDWRLIIPLGYGYNNEWILGDGVPGNRKPVIEDIVINVRYRTRPLTAQ